MNLYSFYSWPNVILSLIGGFLIDRVIGIRWGTILFASIIFLGQCAFAAAAFAKSIYLMYFARLLFGIGGESLSVAQNSYATAWYTPNELNFVFGLSISMARIGSTVNMNTMRPLYKAVGDRFHVVGSSKMAITLLIASSTCVFSLSCAFALAFFYKRYLKAQNDIIIESPQAENETIGEIQDTQPGTSEVMTRPAVEEVKRIEIRDIFRFPAPIWLICVICVTYYVAIFPFISLGLVFFRRKYGLDPSEAAAINSIIFVVSVVASPIVGLAVDYVGYNLTWLASGVALANICHATFAFSSHGVSPIALTAFLGLSYSILASSLWPMVGMVLPQHQRATAYGLIQSVQNLGLGLIAMLTGYIVDTKGYLVLELFFLLCTSIALLSTVCLMLWDSKNGYKLNSRSKRHDKKVPIPQESVETSDTTPLIS
nr:major facilitator superfamily domain containing protein [Hymenolepis microstoma]